jgi:choline dehydrogenase-like flavoprotein
MARVNGRAPVASSASVRADDFASRQFDYIIVGGGTAGLAAAARLAEDPRGFLVGVLEAGPSALQDEKIDIPGNYGQTLGTHLDWQFETLPQPGLGGRSLPWPRGRVLGGSSALNFMTWNRASREDYDAWESLGNAGWGWDDLLPFFKKSETFTGPVAEHQRENKLYHDPDFLGENGPVQIGYSKAFSASHGLWHNTLNALGVKTNEAHLGGSNVGVWTNLGAVDLATQTRSYSATAYYWHNASRANLIVLTGATVQEVSLKKDAAAEAEWTATGVRFVHGGRHYTVAATREVILCAGSVQSPQLLEVSGIGSPDVLTKAGVSLKVRNDEVGENLQEHIMAVMVFEVDPTHANPDDLKHDSEAAAKALEEYHKSLSGPLTVLPNSVAYVPLSDIVAPEVHASLAARVSKLSAFAPHELAILSSRFDEDTRLGQAEFIFDLGNWSAHFQPDRDDGKKYATCLVILQYPFSKGSIHISSRSMDVKPVIDPRYYDGPHGALDAEIMLHSIKFADRIARTQPLAGMVRRRVFPPIPADGVTDEQEEKALRKWIVDYTVTDWHPVGTCAMGKVVDQRLRVRGVKGLRVIDASIIPLQISAHTQATVYAIAEKGAQMILEDTVEGKSKLQALQAASRAWWQCLMGLLANKLASKVWWQHLMGLFANKLAPKAPAKG